MCSSGEWSSGFFFIFVVVFVFRLIGVWFLRVDFVYYFLVLCLVILGWGFEFGYGRLIYFVEIDKRYVSGLSFFRVGFLV